MALLNDIEQMSEQIAAAATSMLSSALEAARNLPYVSARLKPGATPMQRLERDLFWDTFCTHKRYSPPEPGVKAQGVHRRCQKQECLDIRDGLERKLAQIYTD